MTAPDFVIVGRVRKAHGIRGELVIESLTDAPDAIFAAGRRVFAGTITGVVAPSRQEMHITHATPFKGGWIVKFAEISDRTESELWRERYLLLPFDETEPPGEGEVYLHELRGMAVELIDGSPVGTVKEIYEMTHGLLLEVARAGATTVLIPYEASVVEANRTTRVVRIDPPEGLLD